MKRTIIQVIEESNFDIEEAKRIRRKMIEGLSIDSQAKAKLAEIAPSVENLLTLLEDIHQFVKKE